MIPPIYRLTLLADADIKDILTTAFREFGAAQFERYWALIDRAANMVGEEPLRPSSRSRQELGAGVRSFHIEVAANRRGAPLISSNTGRMRAARAR